MHTELLLLMQSFQTQTISYSSANNWVSSLYLAGASVRVLVTPNTLMSQSVPAELKWTVTGRKVSGLHAGTTNSRVPDRLLSSNKSMVHHSWFFRASYLVSPSSICRWQWTSV